MATQPTPTLDAVGTGYTGTGTPSASLTVAGGTGNAVIAWVSLRSSTAVSGVTATCGGSSMTLLGSVTISSVAKTWVFGLLAPTAGSKSVTFGITGGGSPNYKVANAISYNNVGSFGTPVTNTGTGTSLSHSVSSFSGRRIAHAFHVDNIGITVASYSQTSRVNYPGVSGVNEAFIFGDGAGSSSTSFTGTIGTSSAWGSLAVDLLQLNTTLTVTGSTVDITGTAPSLFTETVLTPSAATITVTGTAPTLLLSMVPGSQTLPVTGGTPVLISTTVLSPAAAPMSVTGGTPLVILPITLQPSSAPITVTGSNPTITVGIVIPPTPDQNHLFLVQREQRTLLMEGSRIHTMGPFKRVVDA